MVTFVADGENQLYKRKCKTSLNLACEYYSDHRQSFTSKSFLSFYENNSSFRATPLIFKKCLQLTV